MWHTVFHQEQKFQEVYESDTIDNDDLLYVPLRGAAIINIFSFFPVLLAALVFIVQFWKSGSLDNCSDTAAYIFSFVSEFSQQNIGIIRPTFHNWSIYPHFPVYFKDQPDLNHE